ncbi:MAG: hypothetical protein HFH41_07935 [Lachnospiraceae bacterium]|nr:hypothetical protein [Lachnospiraceae bacterium]
MVVGALAIIGKKVYDMDPFFHYHQPNTKEYFYVLDNQRSQNDGISKHFDYNALITGTSMTENFKTSEMDAIFGTVSIKVPFSGGSFKEINDHLKAALEHNPDLKIIIRGLDMDRFFDSSDAMRFDLGTYPTYLYDKNPFNDVHYLFNRNIIFDRIYPMILEKNSEHFTYSAVWWGKQWEGGNIYRKIEAEQYVIEKILPCRNIKLYSFNNRTDLTTNLNHYKDEIHYVQWVNNSILQWIHDGQYLLTLENYQSYLQEELAFYSTFDYLSLNAQEDYEDDFNAATLLH